MIYPVSAIMKFWHYLLHSLLGVDPALSWLLSIFALVVTVRSIIAPTTWIQMNNGRVAQLLRPKYRELQEEYESRTDADAYSWHQQQRKDLHKENSYSPMAGCVPALIQIPVFLGLYQVLLRMARPAEGLDAAHRAIGFLTPTDVSEFLQVRFLDVPLPAYIAMSTEKLAELGTTKEMTVGVITPLVLATCLFTSVNMAFSTWRGYRTLDWSQSFGVWLTKMLGAFVVLVPIMLLSSAFTAPLPLAIMLYWFGGNLWTMSQFFIMTYLLERKNPLTPEFLAYREETKAAYKVKKAEKKRHKRFINKHRALMLLQPHKIGEHYKTIIGAKAERREAKLALNAEKKNNAELRRKAQRQQAKERREARLAAKRAKAPKNQSDEDQME
ncbi:membrane protein insertase YidC [Corynebacterium sp. H128]